MPQPTRKTQLAQWNDPRSVAFRSAVKGWAFTQEDKLPTMADRAEPYAWLPEHQEILARMRKEPAS